VKIGYIRFSRDKQTTALQEDAMNRESCEQVFTDKMTSFLKNASKLLEVGIWLPHPRTIRYGTLSFQE
jgi:hypothetical protein